jgi:hypothetical protein
MMLLQSTIDKLLKGDVFGFVVETFSGSVPIPVLATMVFGSIGLSYYVVQRSLAIPMVMFVMIGGSTIALGLPVAQQAIMASIVIAVAGIGYVLLNRVRV